MNRIEIHAVDHCVQRCHYCSHAADLVDQPRFYGPEHYVPLFESMAKQGIGWTHIDILGGEPFLNPRLYELAKTVKSFCANLGLMTNCFWLRSEEDIEKYHHILRLFKAIIITLYEPIVEKCGGLENVLRLIGIMQRQFPYVDRWCFGEKPQLVREFARIQFYDVPRPIVYSDCLLRSCAVLRSEGYIVQCCAALRVPNHRARDLTFDVSDEIDTAALERWLNRPVLDLCHYCSIAADGLPFMVEWGRYEKPIGQ